MSALVGAHLQLPKSRDYQRVLVCGSPERASLISTYLEAPQAVAKNREYHSYLGGFGGQKILVLSHGVGAPGAAICFQEVIDAGARAMIRIGTAGGLFAESQIGDVVVAHAAVRQDGLTAAMVPLAYPAVADVELAMLLRGKLQERSWTGRAGTILTTDLFYKGLLSDDLQLYSNAGVLAVEMECSALFIIASLRKVAAAAAVVLDGNPLKKGEYDPRPERLATSVELAAKSALLALAQYPIV